MRKKNVFIYTFDVLPENEDRFTEYLEKFAKPLMTKYCKNWEFYKLSQPLSGSGHPQYIGKFEIPKIEEFLSTEMPAEMRQALDKYKDCFSGEKQWIGELIASNQ